MPTYVLIPGAGGEAWFWHLVVPEIEARGHEAVPVDLPAGDDDAGWNEYADAIERAIGDRTELIVVAQSLAGFSAPIVCRRRSVDLLVLLNAMIPLPGETGEAWWANTNQRAAQAAYLTRIGVRPEDGDDDAVVYFHDVPAAVLAEATKHGEPNQSWTPMTQPWPLERWPDVPTRVLAGRHDRLFPAEFQRRVARERLAFEADLVDGGHLLAWSHPGGLVDRLERYRSEVAAAD
jgi:pimeloyl-ACP methyl ester carboxylesterase